MKDLLMHQVYAKGRSMMAGQTTADQTRTCRSLKMRTAALLDPSQVHRPEPAFDEYNAVHQWKPDVPDNLGKDKEKFRDFDVDESLTNVRETYRKMHTEQTVAKGKEMRENWLSFNHEAMGMMDAVIMLDNLIDESDPDSEIPNSIHAFQTAERIREQHPDKEWFHLIGLIHDVGKVMALYGIPQHFVVGDTFPVGCKFSDKIVFSEQFVDNPDSKIPEYSSKHGIYEPNCGLDKVQMSWGHDEYMYQVLIANGCKIPKEGLYMIRYHSFYPWHCEGEYDHLCSDDDRKMLPSIREFNRFDLYSKADALPDVERIKPYYQSLIDKYCPGKLRW